MKRNVVCFIFLGLLAVACGSAPYTQSYIVPDFDMQRYKRVAILPITNLTQNTFADLQVPKILNKQLTKRKFEVLHRTQIDSILNEEKNIFAINSYADVGKYLNVDGIFHVTVGVYGYNRIRHAGFTVPYTTYDRVRTRGYINNEYVTITTEVPKTNYLTVPDRTYNYAIAEIMISFHDGKSGELVFTILDVYSSHEYTLESVAKTLIDRELNCVLGWNKKIKR
ncbi:MAG: hypothetical protein KAW52_08640 [candidate division Zixibacteria bacterium]|nr:hypothetical protein [candidate division Zixibacteria bacterium]